MNSGKKQFKIADIGEKFNRNFKTFDSLLAEHSTDEIKAIRSQLNEELEEHRERGFLTVAFVGEYGAGKSTIISALTGRNDIEIDGDISTSKTDSYDWNDIKLIDTPGLWTGERPDHDEITYDAIEKADLLVFCLTHSLFDSLTLENFKKLAYEKGYRWKMMLVVNKMSQGAGEEEQKIASYCESLAKALEPQKLDEFPISFIDAQDYLENNIDDGDEFLLEASRFQTFIDELNNFVERRASLARLDTPVRIGLSSVDEAKLVFTRHSTEDKAFFEVLARASRAVQRNRERLRTKVQNIALEATTSIIKEGNDLADAVGEKNAEEFKELNQQAKVKVQNIYQKSEKDLTRACSQAAQELQQEIKELHQSNLVKELIKLDKQKQISAKKIDSGNQLDRLLTYINASVPLGYTIGFGIRDLAINQETKDNFKKAVETFNNAQKVWLKTPEGVGKEAAFKAVQEAEQKVQEATPPLLLKSTHVEGSTLHNFMENIGGIGEKFGLSFELGAAVESAQFIGTAATFLGPALSIVSVIFEIKKINDESKFENQKVEVRNNIRSQFQTIAKDLEMQIARKQEKFEANVYEKVEKQITTVRQQKEEDIATSNKWMRQLIDIRNNFETVIRDIKNMLEVSIA